MAETNIEWADVVANITDGCTIKTLECDNCYAMLMAFRFSGPGQHFEGLAHKVNGKVRWTNQVALHPERLENLRKLKGSKRVFVDSMGDLFHPQVPVELIEALWATMAQTPQHTYLILTKYIENMLPVVTQVCPVPLPNVILGVSVGMVETKFKIDILKQVPAARRMVSFEPLLEDLGQLDLDNIDWAIIGGESGYGPRVHPFNPEWARAIMPQAVLADCAVFIKQMGTRWATKNGADPKGGDWNFWPKDLRVREFPRPLDHDTHAPFPVWVEPPAKPNPTPLTDQARRAAAKAARAEKAAARLIKINRPAPAPAPPSPPLAGQTTFDWYKII
jgi:protein gp37